MKNPVHKIKTADITDGRAARMRGYRRCPDKSEDKAVSMPATFPSWAETRSIRTRQPKSASPPADLVEGTISGKFRSGVPVPRFSDGI